MALSRDRLIGWLVFFRHQIDSDEMLCVQFPTEVSRELSRLGLVELERDPEDPLLQRMTITEAGTLETDLAAPEWGLDPIPA